MDAVTGADKALYYVSAELDVSESKPLMDALIAAAEQPTPFAKDQHVVALWGPEDDGNPPDPESEDKGTYPGKVTVPKLDNKTGGGRHKYDVHFYDDDLERSDYSHGNILTAQEYIVCEPTTIIPGVLVVSGIYPPDSEEENWLADRRQIFIDLLSRKVYREFARCLDTPEGGIDRHVYFVDKPPIASFSEYELVLVGKRFNFSRNIWVDNEGGSLDNDDVSGEDVGDVDDVDDDDDEEEEEDDDDDDDEEEEEEEEEETFALVEGEAQEDEEGEEREAKRHRLQDESHQ